MMVRIGARLLTHIAEVENEKVRLEPLPTLQFPQDSRFNPNSRVLLMIFISMKRAFNLKSCIIAFPSNVSS
jgi:hypothetical protein